LKNAITLTDDRIINRIHLIRGKKVMFDRDLAELYGVQTGVLNQAVKRNIRRFPEDFMFQLTDKEMAIWISQIVISNKEKMGLRKRPYVFTEQGVAMLSSVLNSERAIEVNIQIIRIFTRMRELLASHKDILLKLEAIEKKLLHQDHLNKKHEDEIQVIFEALKQLLDPPETPRKKIGYRLKGEKE